MIQRACGLLGAAAILAAATLPSPEAGAPSPGTPASEPHETAWMVSQEIQGYAAEQDGIYEEFRRTDVPAFRARDAYVLSELWREGWLSDEIKTRLARDHFRIVLLQLPTRGTTPNTVVRVDQTFPFPDVWTEFTPTLFANDRMVWAPDSPQRAHAMSLNGSTLTSLTGGSFTNGQWLQWSIDVCQAKPASGRDAPAPEAAPPAPVAWKVRLWSNPIRLQGLAGR